MTYLCYFWRPFASQDLWVRNQQQRRCCRMQLPGPRFKQNVHIGKSKLSIMTSLQADYLLMASTTLRWTAEQMQELSKHVAIQPPKAFRSMTEDGRVKILDSKSNGPNSKAVYRLLRKENSVSTTSRLRKPIIPLRASHAHDSYRLPSNASRL